MKALPVGYDDFKDLRDNDMYYVDKSGLIRQIVNTKGKAYLFTRPRRFGKSLNLSMIDAFFNIRYEGNKWFDGLNIESCDECMALKNQYPVIYLNLKRLKTDDERTFDRSVKNVLKDLYDGFGYLEDSERLTAVQKAYYNDVIYNDFQTVLPSESLYKLSQMLEVYHGRKVIILIDEYDKPIQETYGAPIQKTVIAFIRNLLSDALKSNSPLYFAIVTGVMQIAKENIFSGLNNLKVDNVFSNKFGEYFGFDEAEVMNMLSYYGHPEKFDECREWYDGYRFGSAEIYNPWSVLNYVDDDYIPGSKWAGTSGNGIIDTLLDTSSRDVWNDLAVLGRGGRLVRRINEHVVYSDIEKNPSVIYSVMVMSGYLNAVRTDGGCEVSIPNKEVFLVYEDVIIGRLCGYQTAGDIERLVGSMKNGDRDAVKDRLEDLVKGVISSKVLDSEHAYQAFMIGMMMGFCGDYRIFGDTLEVGDGFADIRMERLRGPGPHMIVELKKSKDEKDLERDAERALTQIREKDYARGLEGKVLLYGISFHGRKPYVLSDEVD